MVFGARLLQKTAMLMMSHERESESIYSFNNPQKYIVSSCRGFNFLPHYLSRAPHSTQRMLRSCTLSVWYLGQECKSVVWTLNTHTKSLFDYTGHSIIQSLLICISCTGQSASEIVTARQRSWGNVMFSRVSVCHSVGGTVILSGGGVPCEHYP